jgi:hypothetical protein
MANGFYQAGMKHFALGDVVWKAAGGSNIRCGLVNTGTYVVDLTSHEYRNVDSLASAITATSANMTLSDAVTDGVVDASDVTFTGTSGPTSAGIVVWKETGSSATDLLLFWWDTASGLPVTLGGDVTIAWDSGSNKIARI